MGLLNTAVAALSYTLLMTSGLIGVFAWIAAIAVTSLFMVGLAYANPNNKERNFVWLMCNVAGLFSVAICWGLFKLCSLLS